MLRADAFEFVAGKRFHRFAGRLEAGGGAKLWDQFVGEDERFGGSSGALAATGELLHHVNFLRVHGDEQVRRKRPRRGGPDRDAGLVFEPSGNNRELYEGGGVITFLI